MSDSYRFETRWLLDADPSRCWAQMEALLTPGSSSWWSSVTVPRPPARLAVGEEMTLQVRSPLGYRLRVELTLTEVEEPTRLAATSAGDLAGIGRIIVTPHGGGSDVRVLWEVAVRKRWMRAVAPIMRPAFAWAHERVMDDGERSLRARLDQAS